MSDVYEVLALKYATNDRPASHNFIGGDEHDRSMPIDYFVWVIRNQTRTIVVDTGFNPVSGERRARTLTTPVNVALSAVGIDGADIEHVITTHMHYDHAGNNDMFPNACFYMQESEMRYATGSCMCHRLLNHPYEADDVADMIKRVYAGKVSFCIGDRELFPGLSVHHIGGHSRGLQCVRVNTQRYDEFADAMRKEMGVPVTFATAGQAARGPAHINAMLEVLDRFRFEEDMGTTRLRYEAVGVCGLITPWNWPVNQVIVKVAPALAAGCTMVLKPSEFSAMSAALLAEVLHEAGVPAGVFNLVHGDGAGVGAAIATHPDIDMVSFTGSTRAGIEVAKAAASTVKRVAQELGGKSANILLDDVDLEDAVRRGVAGCFTNSGQFCSIPTRMLVPRHLMSRATEIAAIAANGYRVGPTERSDTQLGPLVNRSQFERVQGLIQSGIDEGAVLAAGGTGRPEGLEVGYFVRPTIFSDVRPDMTIAREEIFGPVLSIIPYRDEDEAVAIANGALYGLAGYVQSRDRERARAIARRLRGGQVHINYPPADFHAPFGGYGRSGNGREWGEAGLREYLETKAMIGYEAAR